MSDLPLWVRVSLAVAVATCVGALAAVAALLAGLAWPAAVASAAASIATVLAALALTAIFSKRTWDPKDWLIPAFADLPEDVEAHPNQLLSAQLRVLPFRGREHELKQVADWLAPRKHVGMALITGPAGIGKTRLAAQICLSQGQFGWLTGFLKPNAPREALAAIAAANRPVLVVIDDAVGRLDTVANLLGLLLSRTSTQSWRLVIVAQTAGEWWSSLASRVDTGGNKAMIDALQMDLGPVDLTDEELRKAYQTALRRFHDILGRSPDPHKEAFPAGLNRPLFLEMAALSAVLRLPMNARPKGKGRSLETSLIEEALARELSYWRTSADTMGLQTTSDAVLGRAMAVATLTTATTEKHAAEVLRAIPDLADSEQDRRAICRWLRNVYAGDISAWFKPLEPGLLAEAHVAAVLADVPEIAQNLLAGGDQAQTMGVLANLVQGAARQPSTRAALYAAVAADLERLWGPAIEIALQAADPMASILTEAIRNSKPSSRFVFHALDTLPAQSVALVDLAEAVVQAALEIARSGGGTARELADLWGRLADRQGDAAHYEEALASAREAARLFRELAAEDAGMQPHLADSLDELAMGLLHVGRPEDGIPLAKEAVEIYERLERTDPQAFEPSLARTLNVLSILMFKAGFPLEALSSGEKAAAIYRALARNGSERMAQACASALNNLSNGQGAVGKPKQALESIKEAVDIYRRLAAFAPDSYSPELAKSLVNLSVCFSKCDQPEHALAAIREAVGIWRSLVSIRPGAFRSFLALALIDLAIDLGGVAQIGRRRARVSVAVDQALATADWPGGYKYRSQSYPWASDQKRLKEALDAGAEAVANYRELARDLPEAFEPDLADALRSLANRHAASRNDEPALAAAQEAVDILRAERNAHREALRPKLAGALVTLSHRLSDCDRHGEALAPLEDAVAIYKKLAAEIPDAYKADLDETLSDLADARKDLERSSPTPDGSKADAASQDDPLGRNLRNWLDHIPPAPGSQPEAPPTS
jgi:hypothetical protein